MHARSSKPSFLTLPFAVGDLANLSYAAVLWNCIALRRRSLVSRGGGGGGIILWESFISGREFAVSIILPKRCITFSVVGINITPRFTIPSDGDTESVHSAVQ
jgi:hypothetical protein